MTIRPPPLQPPPTPRYIFQLTKRRKENCALISFAIVYCSAAARPWSSKHLDQCQMTGSVTLQPGLKGKNCQSELNFVLYYYITLMRLVYETREARLKYEINSIFYFNLAQ